MRRRTSNVCWAAASICRKIGRTTRCAETKLRPRGSAVSHEAADRPGTHRSGLGQRRSCGGLDVRRVLRPRWQVSRRPGAKAADVRGRSSRELPRLGSEAPNPAFWAEKEQETRSSQKVPAAGRSPSFLRSAELGQILSRVSGAFVAAVSHQGYGQGSRGLGSQMVRVLAEGRRRPAGTPALLDCGPQRADAGSEVLHRQPRAGRRGSHPAVVAAGGLWALVGRTLLPRGQGRIGDGSLPGPRLALTAPALLPDTGELLVLCPPTAAVRYIGQPRGKSLDDRAGAQRDDRLAVGLRPETRRSPQPTRERRKAAT